MDEPWLTADLTARARALVDLIPHLPSEVRQHRLLAWQEGPGPVQWHLLQSPVTLGRDPACDIVFTTPSVSRRHARLEPRGDTWWITDLASRHGLRRNGHPIPQESPLLTGDWLELGALGMVYLDEATAACP